MPLQSALSLLSQGGRTVVHVSATCGHKEVVELLIDKYNMSPMEKDDVSSHCIAENLTRCITALSLHKSRMKTVHCCLQLVMVTCMW